MQVAFILISSQNKTATTFTNNRRETSDSDLFIIFIVITITIKTISELNQAIEYKHFSSRPNLSSKSIGKLNTYLYKTICICCTQIQIQIIIISCMLKIKSH